MKKTDYKKGITLVLTCSKPKILPFFFAGLKKMDLPKEDMHLLIYDNTDSPAVLEIIMDEIDEFQCAKCKKFKSIRLYKSYLKPRGALKGSGNEKFGASKIYNIWLMWKKIYHMIYTDTFFQLEDDGIYPPDAFKRLYKLLMSSSKVGFVTAIETGRNAVPYVPTRVGIHTMRMRKGKLLERKSFDPKTRGVVEIDAAGVYCFVARTKAYKSGFVDYEPVRNAFSMFAMDNVLTYNMKRHGWKLLADFGCWCNHLQLSIGRICFFGKDQALHFTDLYIPKYDAYAIGVEVKKPNQTRRAYLINKPAPCVDLYPGAGSEDNKKLKKEIKEIKQKIKKVKKKQARSK
ncbi:hypothetical protein ES703_82878 [subsurface metagenome]